MLRLCSTLALSMCLAGCASLGPAYVSPTINSAARFSAQAPGSPKTITAEVQWWRAFNDNTLNQLIDVGLARNLTVAQAVESVIAARESAASTGLNVLPSGSATSEATWTRSNQSSKTDFSYSTSASLSWEIDLFGKLAKEREVAGATLDATMEEANAARLSLIGEIATNYVEARGYQDRLYIARSTLEAQNRTLDLTRQQNSVGLTNSLDLAQLEGDVATTAASIPSLEISLAASVNRLVVLTGQDVATLKKIFAGNGQIPRVSARVSAGIPADLMRDRPDIRQAERELAVATANIGVAEGDLLPSLNLAGVVSIATANSWTLGPSLTLPIFNQGQLKAQVRIEESNARKAYLAYRQTVLEAVEEVENALTAFSKQQTRRTELAKSYTSYSRATELAEERYKVGETTLLTLLTAQRSLYSARDGLAQSSVDVASQYITLSLALGGGWDSSNKQVASARP